jgi:uncharacterized protein YihD (DUF1040 family)
VLRHKKDSTIIAYLLKDKNGNYFHAELEDITEDGLIFKVTDKELAQSGHFPDNYIDSRYLDALGLTLIWVLEEPMQEH